MKPPPRYAFMAELAAVLRLSDDHSALPGAPRERELLVRRAGVLDRQAEADDDPASFAAEQITDAADYALQLLAYDREHATTCGSVPAADPRWDEDPRGYARQEHAAWMYGLR